MAIIRSNYVLRIKGRIVYDQGRHPSGHSSITVTILVQDSGGDPLGSYYESRVRTFRPTVDVDGWFELADYWAYAPLDVGRNYGVFLSAFADTSVYIRAQVNPVSANYYNLATSVGSKSLTCAGVIPLNQPDLDSSPAVMAVYRAMYDVDADGAYGALDDLILVANNAGRINPPHTISWGTLDPYRVWKSSCYLVWVRGVVDVPGRVLIPSDLCVWASDALHPYWGADPNRDVRARAQVRSDGSYDFFFAGRAGSTYYITCGSMTDQLPVLAQAYSYAPPRAGSGVSTRTPQVVDANFDLYLGDCNKDGVIDRSDMDVVALGTVSYDPRADLDGDGIVGPSDVELLCIGLDQVLEASPIGGVSLSSGVNRRSEPEVPSTTCPEPPVWTAIAPANWGAWQDHMQCVAFQNDAVEAAITLTGALGAADNKWVGGVLAPNGYIYGVPFQSDQVLKLNPTTGETTLLGDLGVGTEWYAGGVLAPNGCIYCIPYTGTTVLKIDPATDTLSTFGVLAGAGKWFGGVLAPNGMIYGIPYASTTVLKIDPTTDTVSTFGSLAGLTKWRGGVLAPNGCIYGAPYAMTKHVKIDPVAETATTLGVASGAPVASGAVLALDGKVYCIPVAAPAAWTLKVVDPEDDSETSYAMPAPPPGAIAQAWYGGVLGPDGVIYCMPLQSGAVMRINPATKSATFIEGLTDLTTVPWWSGGVLAPDGSIYGIPGQAPEIMKISFDLPATYGSSVPLAAHWNKY